MYVVPNWGVQVTLADAMLKNIEELKPFMKGEL